MKSIFLSVFFFLGLAAYAADVQSTVELFRVGQSDAERVQAALEDIPSWFSVSDDESRDYVLFRLWGISSVSTPDLRDGVAQFLSGVEELPEHRRAAERAKVALLNRLLFRVPSLILFDQIRISSISIAVGVGANASPKWPWYSADPAFQQNQWVYLVAPLLIRKRPTGCPVGGES